MKLNVPQLLARTKQKMMSLRIDIESELNGFESDKDAAEESFVRQNVLFKGKKKSRNLSKKLNECDSDNPCESHACPCCMKQRRKSIFAEALALYDVWQMGIILTVIFYDSVFTNREFYMLDPVKLKQRLYQQLKRAGFKGPVVGFFDIDYHPEIGLWIPHFHLLVLEIDPPFKEFRKRFYSKSVKLKGRTTTVNRPLLVQKVNDPVRQISYIFKSYYSRVEAYSIDGRRKTKKFRLKPSQLRLSLRVMDRIGFSGSLFLYKARLVGDCLISAVNDK